MLAARGALVTGMDLSPTMIAEAQATRECEWASQAAADFWSRTWRSSTPAKNSISCSASRCCSTSWIRSVARSRAAHGGASCARRTHGVARSCARARRKALRHDRVSRATTQCLPRSVRAGRPRAARDRPASTRRRSRPGCCLICGDFHDRCHCGAGARDVAVGAGRHAVRPARRQTLLARGVRPAACHRRRPCPLAAAPHFRSSSSCCSAYSWRSDSGTNRGSVAPGQAGRQRSDQRDQRRRSRPRHAARSLFIAAAANSEATINLKVPKIIARHCLTAARRMRSGVASSRLHRTVRRSMRAPCRAARCSTSRARMFPSKGCAFATARPPASCCAPSTFACSRRTDRGVRCRHRRRRERESGADRAKPLCEQPRRRAFRRFEPQHHRREERVQRTPRCRHLGRAQRSRTLRGAAISVRDNRFTKERIGILTANVSVAIESNELLDSREAAMQLMGTGAVARGNRISGGAAMGIVAENSRGAVIDGNELDGLTAYGIMVKGSADAVRARQSRAQQRLRPGVRGRQCAQPEHRDRQHHHRAQVQRHRCHRRLADPASQSCSATARARAQGRRLRIRAAARKCGRSRSSKATISTHAASSSRHGGAAPPANTGLPR